VYHYHPKHILYSRGPDNMGWKVNKESAVLLGGSRAVLMQVAHPLVAMGVSEHSDYMTDPFGRAVRTFMLGELLTFGSQVKAYQAARTINRKHFTVHGDLPIDAGTFSKGTHYNARDPDLLLWVHATLIDTWILCYMLFVGTLTSTEQEAYYQESKEIAHLLGLIPEKMPNTFGDLQDYIDGMLESDKLMATPQARQIAQQLLFPPAPLLFRPLMHLNLQLTSALLPQQIRNIFGIQWTARRQTVFDMSAKGMRSIIPHLPSTLREMPITKQLMRETTENFIKQNQITQPG
jgi:uncharacterized protein (DUF2236 family)